MGHISLALHFFFANGDITMNSNITPEVVALAHQLLAPFSQYKAILQEDLTSKIIRLPDEKIKEQKIKYFYLDEIEQQLKNIVND